MAVQFTWLSHSTFLFDISGHKAITDPFLTGNDLAPRQAEDIDVELILLSHAHNDHVADVIPIAQRTGAKVVSTFEMMNWFSQKGLDNLAPINTGGTFKGEFLTAKWTIAFHSSSFADGAYGGMPHGFVITAEAKKLYFAGDTGLFGDMTLIGEEGLDVAFLPIGDTFTMGPEDSIKAIKLLKPRYVVPMHYNTFPLIVQDVVHWAEMVNRETNAQPIVLDPGSSHTLE